MVTNHVTFLVEEFGIKQGGHYSDYGHAVKAFGSLQGAIAYCNNPPMDLSTSFLAVRSLENTERPVSLRQNQPSVIFSILDENRRDLQQHVIDLDAVTSMEMRVQRLANDLRQTDENGYTVRHKLRRIATH